MVIRKHGEHCCLVSVSLMMLLNLEKGLLKLNLLKVEQDLLFLEGVTIKFVFNQLNLLFIRTV